MKLVSATEDRSVHFHQVPTEVGRVRVRKYCEAEDQELSAGEIGKGFEVSKDTLIAVTDAELEEMPLPTAKAIEMVAFVPAEARGFAESWPRTMENARGSLAICGAAYGFWSDTGQVGVSGEVKMIFADGRVRLSSTAPSPSTPPVTHCGRVDALADRGDLAGELVTDGILERDAGSVDLSDLIVRPGRCIPARPPAPSSRRSSTPLTATCRTT
ncbi:Ku protein [Streptomyces sp. NPDC088358]|uniref:Ku protein n=1 Tax=Streptomyces sp. NPDC088358 TaxID=3365857 RepID=UPI0038130A0F